MKKKTMLKIIFLSLALSSCGLIEKFKGSDQPTDADAASTSENVVDNGNADVTDDLFSKTLEETSEPSVATDAPSNIDPLADSDLRSLEDEFSPAGKETSIAVTPTQTNSTVKQEAPVHVSEALPEIKTEVAPASYNESGTVKKYQVQRGETLMQIAFKLYGDISKWKDLKAMNSDQLIHNSSLKANAVLKYRAPNAPFVWNPQGAPYLIKQGETLGTISNTVYQTPKKWKTIFENNRPLIKNPNVIYAGFTLYYPNGGMANYVQPKAEQPKRDVAVEEVLVDAIANESAAPIEKLAPAPTTPAPAITKDDEAQMDEAIQTISATKREAVKRALDKVNAQSSSGGEIDLVNNVTVPHGPEIAPDIDEEVQVLE